MWTKPMGSVLTPILESTAGSPFDVIIGNYSPEENGDLTIGDRLRKIHDDLRLDEMASLE